MKTRILVLTGDSKLRKYNILFGDNAVRFYINVNKLNDTGYVTEIRDKIALEFKNGGYNAFGMEDKRLFHRLGFCSDMGYDIDAGKFFDSFLDWSDESVRLISVDMNDFCIPMFDQDTLRDSDVILKGQYGNKNDYSEKIVWCPYWTGYNSFLSVVNANWSSVKKIEKYDVSFVGNVNTYPKRKNLIRTVFGGQTFKDDGSTYIRYATTHSRLRPNDYAKILIDSKICLNIRGTGLLAQRFFEILSMGCFCLNDSYLLDIDWAVSPINDVFGDCCGIFDGDNTDSLSEKMNWFLEHPNERVRIRENGKRFWDVCCSRKAMSDFGKMFLEQFASNNVDCVKSMFRKLCLRR